MLQACGIPTSARLATRSLAPVVAIVGARAASGNGMARAHDLAGELAAAGAVVVSGGAVGIDAAAHAGALAADGATVAVLGSGLFDPYPSRHRPLFDAIVDAGGALVSPFAPGLHPQRWFFARRNRVIAGMADIVVVVEASASSGSLYTAQAAREYGRALGAFPGTAGTELLLAQGAALIETADDVHQALAGRPRVRLPEGPEPGSDEALLLAVLDGTRPQDAQAVAERAGVPGYRAVRALSALEMEGLALLCPGGLYVRSALAAHI